MGSCARSNCSPPYRLPCPAQLAGVVARLKRRESLCGALLVRLVDERGHLDDAKKL